MTTESDPSRDESNQPNEFGFAGDPSTPQPRPEPSGTGDGESVAVPADDLTSPVTRAIEDATEPGKN